MFFFQLTRAEHLTSNLILTNCTFVNVISAAWACLLVSHWGGQWTICWYNEDPSAYLIWAKVCGDVAAPVCEFLPSEAPSWGDSEPRPGFGATAGLFCRRSAVWCGGQEQGQAHSEPCQLGCGDAMAVSERETTNAQDCRAPQEPPTVLDSPGFGREQNSPYGWLYVGRHALQFPQVH